MNLQILEKKQLFIGISSTANPILPVLIIRHSSEGRRHSKPPCIRKMHWHRCRRVSWRVWCQERKYTAWRWWAEQQSWWDQQLHLVASCFFGPIFLFLSLEWHCTGTILFIILKIWLSLSLSLSLSLWLYVSHCSLWELANCNLEKTAFVCDN